MNNNDLNTDEIRRQLRAVDRMNTTVMPSWRSALARLVGDDEIGTDEKATILGVPSPNRRQLFKIGGASILGAALLGACGSDAADAPAATSGSTAAAPTTGPVNSAPVSSAPANSAPATTPAANSAEMDLVLARTAASLEKLAVDTYGT
ncbi:MAG TPA: hypothetical protein VFE86_13155, partial [Ilumatobacteraceae bacterium]|nr:hypothetical protein [Ilumatobacteraceae bacterium]